MDITLFERVNQLRHWVYMQQLAAIQVVCLVMAFVIHRKNQRVKCVNLLSRELRLHRQRVREEVMDDLSNRAKCRDTIRMNKEAFLKLCNILVSDGGLRSTQRMSGLPHRKGLIAPFRGVRYHLKEYSARGPRNPRELFNHHHASLRNTIERAFGVLKKKFPIIRSTTEPFYSCETQSDIFLAYCILHNFLQVEDRDLVAEEEEIKELEKEVPEVEFFAPRDRGEDGAIADAIRKRIANAMWSNYTLHQQDNEFDMEE